MSDRLEAFLAIQDLCCGRFSCQGVFEACADMTAQTIGLMAETPEQAADDIRQTAEDIIKTVLDNWENLRNARRLLLQDARGSA